MARSVITAMIEPSLIAQSDGTITTLTLNRPDRGNALNSELLELLDRAFDDALDRGARLILFRAAGRDFCTGFDLSNVETETHGDLLLRFVNIERFLQKVDATRVVTMAVARGRVLGAGADLFVACRHRICCPGTQFRFPGPAFGLVLGIRRLAERVGRDRALDTLISGATIDTEAALRLGLATQVVPENELEAAIKTTATPAARLDSATIAALHHAIADAGHDRDLAALVRSAARADFKDRIVAYRKLLRAPGPERK
jgi:enoyl-CoA hydratase